MTSVKNGIIQEFEEKNQIGDKVSKLKALYSELDDGKITKEEFPYRVENETGIKWNSKANKVINMPSTKHSNFTNLIKSLDCLQKKKIQMPVYSSKNYHPVINYNRVIDHKRVVHPKGTIQSELISENVHKLLKKHINVVEFKEVLIKNNIRLNADPIDRQLRLIEQGKHMKYKEVMACILKYKNQDNKLEAFKENVDNIKPTLAHKPSQSVAATPKTNKKLITTPTYNSQKDIYDWDTLNYQEALKTINNTPTPKVNCRSFSQVFSLEEDANLKLSKKKSNLENPNNKNEGNFIVWKGSKQVRKIDVDLTVDNSISPKKSRATYKNESNVLLSDRKVAPSKELNSSRSTKNFKLHQTSDENVLKV